ncbi:MAG: peptide ABC transporter substrate-binding protein [Treponema sp.]|jgi:oligopeptide transport system substrate-binding protein|nr:peptide ABC transporter substrate-binding protein [Treponema sp.]
MKASKKIVSLVLILLAAAGSVFAGGGKEKPVAAANVSGGGVLTIQNEAAVATVDFHGSSDASSLGAMRLIGEGLYYLDGNDVFQLGLAESASKSPDGLTLTYKIRDAKWSDGSPLSAQDFVYAWRRLGNPATAAPYRWLLNTAAIENSQDVIAGKQPPEALGVRALDDKTLQVTLSSPVAFIEGLFNFPAFFPLKESFVKAQGSKFATSPETVLSIGPYKITRFEPNAEVVETVKNPFYYRARDVKLDGIRYQTIKDLQQAALAYQSGIIDVIPRLSGEQIDLYRDDPEFRSELSGRVYYLTPNIKANKYLANHNLRRALAVSIDRDALVKNIIRNGAAPAEYLVARGLAKAPDDNSDFRDGEAGVGDELHYKPAKGLEYWNKAKQELGVDKLTFSIIHEDGEFFVNVSQFIQAQLQSNLPGLSITILSMPKKSHTDKYYGGDFELALHRWGPDYRDPQTYTDLWLSGQHPSYANKEYDAIAISASGGELARNPVKRFHELRRAEQIVLRDVGTIPLFQDGMASLLKSYVTGAEYHGVQGGTTYLWATKSPAGLAGR